MGTTGPGGATIPRREGRGGPFPGAAVLWKRDLVHFLRQPARIAGFIGSPLIFWIVIGSGFNRSFSYPPGQPGISYLEYYFPGTVVLTMLFTAIFASISIIEDRHSGFLQGVLVAPVPGVSIAAGKILGAATLAWIQALLLLCLVPLLGIGVTAEGAIATVSSLFVLGMGLAGLGFLIAWRMDTTQGFHAVMNLVLVPLWLLSGALFPVEGAAAWVGAVIRVNPLYYGMAAFRQSLYMGTSHTPQEALPLAFNLMIISVFSVVTIVLSAASVKTRRP
jgi:ABC-2 type transport system permease protein